MTGQMFKGLTIRDLTVSYGSVVAVRSISLTVEPGTVVALIGSNGAGKSSTIRAVAGLTPCRGRIGFDGVDLGGEDASLRPELGISTVPEGRALFPTLTVEDNLRLAVLPLTRRKAINLSTRLEAIYELFPVLRDRVRQPAGTLSGGQQQMLAIGRALLPGCRLLVLDEPSLGLAPIVVDEVYEVLERVKQSDVAVLLVEQFVGKALALADRVCVMARGSIVLEASAEELASMPTGVLDAYLGRGERGARVSSGRQEGYAAQRTAPEL